MTRDSKTEEIENIERYLALSSSSPRVGFRPASPSEDFETIYCITPKVIPTPAAPKPQCHPTFSPK